MKEYAEKARAIRKLNAVIKLQFGLRKWLKKIRKIKEMKKNKLFLFAVIKI